MTFKTTIELDIEVEYDGAPEEMATRLDPGCNAEIEITGVTILQNSSELELKDCQTEAITAELWEHVAETHQDALSAKAEAQADDARDRRMGL